ncbi:MAG: hypothetical protein QJR02_01515 [Sinobacteraceae bacterium]|nr:hypothetical protein [Nevskiaceae bacterium]
MQNNDTRQLDRNLAECYASAVALYLRTGIHQGISYSSRDRAFFAEPSDEGCAPDEWDLYVGELWRQVVPELGVETVPTAAGYDEGLLRNAVRDALLARPGIASAIVARREREATGHGFDS